MLQLVLNGLAMGCIYALVALGLLTIFNAVRVVNFGQGDSFVTLTGQASQPDASIELIKGGVARRDRHRRTPVSHVAV